MSIMPIQTNRENPYDIPPELLPNYDLIITEDDKPVDSIYCERQHRLLTDVLSVSWKVPGEGRPYFAATDVGVFFAINESPLVPDVFVSLDVAPPSADMKEKKNKSYFIWVYGKPPDAVVEVVSNREGGELSEKLRAYARIKVAYYIVWDPNGYLSDTPLQCFMLHGRDYVSCDPWFPALELGVTVWKGLFDQMEGTWLRWCDAQGKVLQTGFERSEKLAEKLRALGIDPDQA